MSVRSPLRRPGAIWAKLSPGRQLGLQSLLLFAVLAALFIPSIGLRATRNASITGDEPFYLLTTQSLIDDGNFDLREQYERESYRSWFDHPDGLWKQSVPLPGGRIVSPHEPGLSVLLLPGFATGGLRGAQVELLLLAATTFTLAFLVAAMETGRRWLPLGVTAVVALSAPGFVYSTEIYPELPAGCCLLLALLAMRLRPGALRPAAVAIALTALAWLGLKYVPLGLLVGAVYVFRVSGAERGAFVALAGASGAAYIWGHLALFGSLTPYRANTVYEGASTAAVLDSHVAFHDRTYRLWGLFIDRRFGIGRWAPVLLAVWPALPLVARAGRNGSLVAGLVVTQILVATFVSVTMMGFWFPGRMLMVVYPLFPLVLTVLVTRLPAWGRWAALAATAYSLLVTALLVQAARGGEVAIAVDPFDMKAAPFQAPGFLFPQYTSWSIETNLLNAAWLLALAGATLAVGARSRRSSKSRRAWSRWGRSTIRGSNPRRVA